MNAKQIIFLFGGITIGMVIGYSGRSALERSQSEVAFAADNIRMGQIAISLRMLRNGKFDTSIEALESILDGDLITTAGLLKAGKVNVKNDKALKIVKKYRADYHRSVNPDVDAMVAMTLTNVLDP